MKGRHILALTAALLVAGNLVSEALMSASGHSRKSSALISGSCTFAMLCLASVCCLKKSGPNLVPLMAIAFFTGGLTIAADDFFRLSAHGKCILEDGKRITIKAVILEYGLTGKGKTFLLAELPGEKTLVYGIPDSLEFTAGDTLNATVRVSAVKNFTENFDYRRHMQRKGIYHLCFIYSTADFRISPCRSAGLRFQPQRQRQKFSAAVDSLLPGTERKETRAVVKALAYGYMDEIPASTIEAFRSSGAMHLLALSGMHLNLIHLILSRILAIAGNSSRIRKIRSIAILLVLWFYTVFTGCGMSILRAMTMVTVYETGEFLGRRKNGIGALSLSAVIITLWNPHAPSDIGFQLSCAAMLGIFLIHPQIISLFPFKRQLAVSFRNTCSVSVSCQLLTMPLVFIHFGTFSIFSLSINILCSPLASTALILVPISFISDSLGWSGFLSPADILEKTVLLFIYLNTIVPR